MDDFTDKLTRKRLKVSDLLLNNGQIEGLPRNPRFIRDAKFDALKKSITDDPEFMEVREIIVIPFEKKYVAIGGNQRLRAVRDLGWKEAPCKILPADTPAKKLRAYAVKDNNEFGEWDWDIANNEWDIDEWKNDFGVDWFGFNMGIGEENEEDDSESIDIETNEPSHRRVQQLLGISFNLSEEEEQLLMRSIERYKKKTSTVNGYFYHLLKYEPKE